MYDFGKDNKFIWLLLLLAVIFWLGPKHLVDQSRKRRWTINIPLLIAASVLVLVGITLYQQHSPKVLETQKVERI